MISLENHSRVALSVICLFSISNCFWSGSKEGFFFPSAFIGFNNVKCFNVSQLGLKID